MNDSPASNARRPAERFSVAGWIVDVPSHHISKNGKTTRLEPRTMAVLAYLAIRPGETVSREEFEHEVWPGQVVVYEALSNSIAKLRKALGDDPKHHRIIETIPKVGYRLIGEVVRLEASGPAPQDSASLSPGRVRVNRFLPWAGTAVVAIVLIGSAFIWLPTRQSANTDATSPPDQTSIAVLPFTNMSGDPEQDYFADGMTDDLITDLSKVSGLFVVARNATFKYKGTPIDLAKVSTELGVEYLLEGSVRRIGDQVRINAQLIDTKSGGHMWAERYDSSLTEIFTLQEEIAKNIVSALAIERTPEDQVARASWETDNPEAYEFFLQAWAHYRLYTPDDFIKAIPNLEASLRLDPDYGRAHGLLATIYYHTFSNGWQSVLGTSMDGTIEKLERHLNEAFKNPTSLTLQTASRYSASLGRHDEALAYAKRSIAADPNDGFAYIALARILNRHDKPAQGLAAVKMAARLDPGGNLRGSYSYRIGESYYHLGKFEEAAEEFNKMRQVNPGDEWNILYLAATYGYLGRKQAATSAMKAFDKIRSGMGRRAYTLANMDGWHFPNPDVRERFREGLRRAGVRPGVSASRAYPIDKPPPEIEGAETIDVVQAKTLFDRGVPFVDVRKDPDWNTERIPGAVQLHLYADFSESNLSEIAARDDEVVVYAYGLHSGLSTTAVMRAVSWGYGKVYFYREGFPSWKTAGHPIETPSN